MQPDLYGDIQYLNGVGPRLAGRLKRLGVEQVFDLLVHFPRSYEDRRSVRLLKEVQEDEKATFKFTVLQHDTFFYKGKTHPKIEVRDESGSAYLYCFNRSFITNTLAIGTSFYLTGSYTRKYRVPAFSQFEYEVDTGAGDLRIMPIYPLTEGVSQKSMRKLVKTVLSLYPEGPAEDLPAFIREGYRIRPKHSLFSEIHFPSSWYSLRRAKEYYSYGEFFKFQVVCALARESQHETKKKRITFAGSLRDTFFAGLPFSFTAAQNRVLDEVEHDLLGERPMNRLIQGDVGCGKTVVALAAGLDVIERGGQVAFMAPTEILARQHYHTMTAYLEGTDATAAFVSGSVKGLERKEIMLELLRGNIDILCGTHALFSDDIEFRNLSLAVIDEQQKFGVLQRGALRSKGDHPDCLVMSATPIPRTLAMTLYGDLDISVIDEMPRGRESVETHIVKQAQIKRVYERVLTEVGAGRQAYFIYPLIEEGQSNDVRNAVESYERLKNEVFGDLRVALIHGRMDDEKKDKVMSGFRNGEYDILVATTVVEVGVHVPNATVMVIEQAERFGLSSIHQLRGRIGRGGDRSFCFLVPDRTTGKEAFNRLRILQDTHDGFKIAEWDLKLRGQGELMGKRQSGVPQFIIDDLEINAKLLHRAQKDARGLVEGEIGTGEQRRRYLDGFIKSEGYRNAMLYFGG